MPPPSPPPVVRRWYTDDERESEEGRVLSRIGGSITMVNTFVLVKTICDGSNHGFVELFRSYIKQYDGWTLMVICDLHNHPPAEYMEGHAFAMRLKEHKKQLVADLTNQNVSPHDILSILKECDENNVSTLKTIYNERLKIRSSRNYGKTPMQVLMEILNEKYFVTEFSVNNVLNYLDEVWLNKYKEMFVLVWIDQHLNFGQRTTNRVESAHSNLKKYLDGTNSSLDKFIGCLDRFVRSQLPSIHDSLEKNRIVRKREHDLPCFRLLWGSVSHEAFDKLVGELYWLSENQIDSSNCGCKLQHNCGLPCACMLSIYLNSGEYIPLDSIDIFWRKLDLSESSSVANEDIHCEDDLEMIKEKFYQQSIAGKKSMIRKLRDIFLPSKTRIKEPAIQKNTRGRPNLKKQQQKRVDSTNQAPRRRSYSTTSKYDGLNSTWMNKEPERHSSYVIVIPDMNEAILEFDEAITDMNEAIPYLNEAIPDSNETIPGLNKFLDSKQEPQ
ncbi:unnamed protein product [Lactuca virosa]|uniref:Protein FAR1-RELATED SEQUENCE n=1 Tax=Lactuca virosa TaxID=75947 RepID=A0AAU9LTL9_9ASTR|nr:unnamed protein product [Lactuca virosa]